VTGSLAIARAARIVRGGGVIAYPTEAVFGLGCDPRNRAAVMRLLAIKRRSWRKGLILIAASLEQLEPYILQPPEPHRGEMLASWPGPHTWVVTARTGAPRWITGGRDSLAVRVTAHPIARDLCLRAGTALVSTSANLSRRPPHRRLLRLRRDLGRRIDYVLAGPLGASAQPTAIRDARSGALLRASAGTRP
jgi:L-threonylcarbamoyladenylate synthase